LIHGFLIETSPDDDKPVPAVSVRPFRKLHQRVNDAMGGVDRRWSVRLAGDRNEALDAQDLHAGSPQQHSQEQSQLFARDRPLADKRDRSNVLSVGTHASRLAWAALGPQNAIERKPTGNVIHPIGLQIGPAKKIGETQIRPIDGLGEWVCRRQSRPRAGEVSREALPARSVLVSTIVSANAICFTASNA
jgi:hypothetical protein